MIKSQCLLTNHQLMPLDLPEPRRIRKLISMPLSESTRQEVGEEPCVSKAEDVADPNNVVDVSVQADDSLPFDAERDRRLLKAFNLFNRSNTGRLDKNGIVNALRVAGGCPSQAMLKWLPSSATLPDLRQMIKAYPERVGFMADQEAELTKLSELLDKSQTGLITKIDLGKILTSGGDPLETSDARELMADPKLTFTSPKNGDIEIKRFLRNLVA
jgi:Ca2+-binding EF-hand superfamily protein